MRSDTGAAGTSPYLVWLKLFSATAKAPERLRHASCPRCGQTPLDAQYVASPDDRIGYAALWCRNCWHGIWVSRTGVPDGWDYATFEEAEGGLIPDFVRVEPEEGTG